MIYFLFHRSAKGQARVGLSAVGFPEIHASQGTKGSGYTMGIITAMQVLAWQQELWDLVKVLAEVYE